jgi:hypothetical protein
MDHQNELSNNGQNGVLKKKKKKNKKKKNKKKKIAKKYVNISIMVQTRLVLGVWLGTKSQVTLFFPHVDKTSSQCLKKNNEK